MFSNIQGDCSYFIRPYYYSDYIPYEEYSALNYDLNNPHDLTKLKCNHIFHSRCLVKYGKESCPKCDGRQFSDYYQKEVSTLVEYVPGNFNLYDEEESESLSSPPLPPSNEGEEHSESLSFDEDTPIESRPHQHRRFNRVLTMKLPL